MVMALSFASIPYISLSSQILGIIRPSKNWVKKVYKKGLGRRRAIQAKSICDIGSGLSDGIHFYSFFGEERNRFFRVNLEMDF